MADEKITLQVVAPDNRSQRDFERLQDGKNLHEYFSVEWSENRVQFIGVMHDENRVGTAVFSYLEKEKALVCNALSCEPIDKADFAVNVSILAEKWAREIGAEKLRFWTARDGLARLMKLNGYVISLVGEKELKDISNG